MTLRQTQQRVSLQSKNELQFCFRGILFFDNDGEVDSLKKHDDLHHIFSWYT